MKIYTNELRTVELDPNQCDLELGRLEIKEEIIHHDAIEGVKELGHYEVIAEYPNGGKDIKWIVDTPEIEAQDAYDEVFTYQVYIPYTENYLAQRQCEKDIQEYQDLLAQTDYQVLKYMEGLYTEEVFTPIKEYRQSLRRKINETRDKLRDLLKEEQEAQSNN